MKKRAFLVMVAVVGSMALSPGFLRAEIKANSTANKSVQTIRVRFLIPRSKSTDTIYDIFQRQVQDRCDAVVKLFGTGELIVDFALDGDIGKEGFRIEDGASGAIRIVGNDEQGLLYGVGKFLRTSRYGQGGFAPGLWRGTSVAECPFRAAYFATHFGNWYQSAPHEEIERYIEDVALWGFNTWVFTFPVDAYSDFDRARQHITQLRGLMATAKRVGLQVAIGNAANNALTSAPKEIAAIQPPGKPPSGGIVCPSIPEGHDYLLNIWSQTMGAFADIGGGIDYICACPYDSGGCGCEKCKPWASNGFLKISKDIIAQERKKNPKCALILSTWLFSADEWKGLAEALAKDKDQGWIDYFMGGGINANSMNGYPQYPLEHGTPGNIPLVNFPEISMYGMSPWGGFGANPQPRRLQTLWNEESRMLSGGLLYSEGIYEDINKAISGQLFWKKDGDVDEIVREYIAFEYSPGVVDEVLEAIHILENALNTNHWDTRRGNITESVCEAYDLIMKADEKLSLRARNSWRWRILYLRAIIDNEIFKNEGKIEGEALKQAFDELTEIYHAKKATPALQPIQLP